ncbi:hypothetical protein MPLA_1060004 [Mesorhizobium sp. ORS 3359]|nr:hypothetical protein MPLA_1060004 [Mesorhizobium sp. ORS 3359]
MKGKKRLTTRPQYYCSWRYAAELVRWPSAYPLRIQTYPLSCYLILYARRQAYESKVTKIFSAGKSNS